uniref:Glycine cleavage system H protein n=1 Tax=Corethron hystrix TaxID=216773 RepID=A0A7S1FYD8_9STRA|mmetsp:Transcript_38139/g.88762  ORF Transcript_38139/g.88762 Transcript_38139/m.88762 type:complete len:162 (+) Transcript_38139:131-616(+)
MSSTIAVRSLFRAAPAASRVMARGVALSPKIASARFMTSYFTPAHEYIKVEDGVGTIGITDFAKAALGDIVYVDLPEEGDEFEKGDSFGSVESVKAASDVYVPVSGEVVESNDDMSDNYGVVNTDAEGDGWFIKLKLSDESELEDLMGEAEYKAHCEAEAH